MEKIQINPELRVDFHRQLAQEEKKSPASALAEVILEKIPSKDWVLSFWDKQF